MIIYHCKNGRVAADDEGEGPETSNSVKWEVKPESLSNENETRGLVQSKVRSAIFQMKIETRILSQKKQNCTRRDQR